MLFVVLIDLYYLLNSFNKDYFKILEVKADGYYLEKFLNFYHDDILKFMPEFAGKVSMDAKVFFILSNMVPAGLLISRTHDDGKLWIEMDFTIPDYRDFKLGRFLYSHQAEVFDAANHDRVFCQANTKTHQKYLKTDGGSHPSKMVFMF